MDKAVDKIKELGGEESCYGAGVKFLRNWKVGALEYAKIPELDGVDISKYRRPGHFESRISAI